MQAVDALTKAADLHRQAALDKLMLDHERRSMEAEDMRTQNAALTRMAFTHPPMAGRTWQAMYHAATERCLALEDLFQAAEDDLQEDENGTDIENVGGASPTCVICRSIGWDHLVFYNLTDPIHDSYFGSMGRHAYNNLNQRVVCSECYRPN